ncbi:hypothetical protein FRC11_002131 [Ceratobasidium sp. 423]|nr:hypothetical protein FRC11_002131 [Ceratobasidium sp. 423]
MRSPDPNDQEMANADKYEGRNKDDDDNQDLISSVYEDNEDAHWSKLYDMMCQMAIMQNNLIQNVQRINEQVQNQAAPAFIAQADTKGKVTSHISPPKPMLPIEWDQTIECVLLAGRQPRDKRLVMLMLYESRLQLGVDRTSSDKEDYTIPGMYKIINKKELSEEVTQLKWYVPFKPQQ